MRSALSLASCTRCAPPLHMLGLQFSPVPLPLPRPRAVQGGLLPASDWDSLDRDWLSPVARGSLLPDFALEGPVDVYLSQPTALQVGMYALFPLAQRGCCIGPGLGDIACAGMPAAPVADARSNARQQHVDGQQHVDSSPRMPALQPPILPTP